MKKGLLFALAAAAPVAVVVAIFLSGQTVVVELNEAELQEHLDSGFPIEKGVLSTTGGILRLRSWGG